MIDVQQSARIKLDSKVELRVMFELALVCALPLCMPPGHPHHSTSTIRYRPSGRQQGELHNRTLEGERLPRYPHIHMFHQFRYKNNYPARNETTCTHTAQRHAQLNDAQSPRDQIGNVDARALDRVHKTSQQEAQTRRVWKVA
jgi:hypothetical protein